MTRREAVRRAAARLAAADVASPQLDARLLALEAFGIDHAILLADGNVPIALGDSDCLDRLVERRIAGEPVARITGRREFWGLDFALAPETLVPRPDTETVVEAALAEVGDPDRPLRVLDLGTGSGCLLLAVMSELPEAFGVGVDLSPVAAATARANAQALGLGGRTGFVVGDWSASISGSFDLVVSNPPYIVSGEIAELDKDVRDHDPRLALDGGPDGLHHYREILGQAAPLLSPGAAMVLELGAGQGPEVSGLALDAGLKIRRIVPDLAGVPRALVAGRGPMSGNR
ncbi:peptide chain release factor N(5)-glutamine methyltransferase [Hansschlegelia plantiphila]|uniref:Release factor glutamine methyltransferase n=1 Tax=Hansschlegelia plantiphila TaxID=374655 RepID=A0A9W6MVH4_9HYPH|nr:peptide chain release factor N(5)-glutamine methyltransferase [Hansschlegelia plantiphila]GLK68439.1 release factor glutamine methyltransferase [Hansschlegelia plantiphila]